MVLVLYSALKVGSLRVPAVVLATYLTGGAMAGLVLGSCLPLARTRLGASLLGVLALVPVYIAMGALDVYGASDERVGWLWFVISGIVVGAGAGYTIRDVVFPDLDDQLS